MKTGASSVPFRQGWASCSQTRRITGALATNLHYDGTGWKSICRICPLGTLHCVYHISFPTEYVKNDNRVRKSGRENLLLEAHTVSKKGGSLLSMTKLCITIQASTQSVLFMPSWCKDGTLIVYSLSHLDVLTALAEEVRVARVRFGDIMVLWWSIHPVASELCTPSPGVSNRLP
jgi:hypothetical protein